jgi:hypothetical protein
MSTAAATFKAAANTTRHVNSTRTSASRAASPTTPAAKQPNSSILKHIYDAHPEPLNCASVWPTHVFATDPTHPLHIATTRRLAAFDPNILNWSVHVSVDLSKKVVVRNWAKRRVREAFKAELKEKGFDAWGRRLVQRREGMGNLKGALSIRIGAKSTGVLTFSGEEVRRECGLVLARVLTHMRAARKEDKKEEKDVLRIQSKDQQIRPHRGYNPLPPPVYKPFDERG